MKAKIEKIKVETIWDVANYISKGMAPKEEDAEKAILTMENIQRNAQIEAGKYSEGSEVTFSSIEVADLMSQVATNIRVTQKKWTIAGIIGLVFAATTSASVGYMCGQNSVYNKLQIITTIPRE